MFLKYNSSQHMQSFKSVFDESFSSTVQKDIRMNHFYGSTLGDYDRSTLILFFSSTSSPSQAHLMNRSQAQCGKASKQITRAEMGSCIVCIDQIQLWRIGQRLIAAPWGGQNLIDSHYGAFGLSNKSSFDESHASTLDSSYESSYGRTPGDCNGGVFNLLFSGTLNESYWSIHNESYGSTFNASYS